MSSLSEKGKLGGKKLKTKKLGVLSKERERERITKDFGNPEKA